MRGAAPGGIKMEEGNKRVDPTFVIARAAHQSGFLRGLGIGFLSGLVATGVIAGLYFWSLV